MNDVYFLKDDGINSKDKNIDPLSKLGKPEKIVKALDFLISTKYQELKISAFKNNLSFLLKLF